MSETVIFYSGPIVTRQEAIAKGLKYYFTGKPCVNGHIQKRYTNGGACCACIRMSLSLRLQKNPEKIRKMQKLSREKQTLEQRRIWQKRYIDKNREKYLALKKQRRIKYKEKYPEKGYEQTKLWRNKNPEKLAVQWMRRRAIKKSFSDGTVNEKVINNIYKQQKGKCVYCKVKLNSSFHRDHIVPLSKGGAHTYKNIQLLCAKCNMSKNDKHPIDYAQKIGMLL